MVEERLAVWVQRGEFMYLALKDITVNCGLDAQSMLYPSLEDHRHMSFTRNLYSVSHSGSPTRSINQSITNAHTYRASLLLIKLY